MIGVLFATLQEAEPFLEMVLAEPTTRVKLSVYNGRLPSPGNRTIRAGIMGMGPDAAEWAARSFLEDYPVKALVNAGICGALGNGPPFAPGSTFTVSHVLPEPSYANSDAGSTALYSGPWADLPKARLVTVNKPVFDSGRRYELSKFGDLVDMEGAAVAQAADLFGIPCCMIKGVTDMADKGERERLQQNVNLVSRRIARLLVDGLANFKLPEKSAVSSGLAERKQ